jgi:hypothetical protein
MLVIQLKNLFFVSQLLCKVSLLIPLADTLIGDSGLSELQQDKQPSFQT